MNNESMRKKCTSLAAGTALLGGLTLAGFAGGASGASLGSHGCDLRVLDLFPGNDRKRMDTMK
jgi:hypothetical protein